MKFSVLCVVAAAGVLYSPPVAAFQADNGGRHLESQSTPISKSAMYMSTGGYLQSLSSAKPKTLTFSSKTVGSGYPPSLVEKPTPTTSKTVENVVVISRNDPIKAERTNRALLKTRLDMESKSRAKQVKIGSAKYYAGPTNGSSPMPTTARPKNYGGYSTPISNAVGGYSASLGKPVEEPAVEMQSELFAETARFTQPERETSVNFFEQSERFSIPPSQYAELAFPRQLEQGMTNGRPALNDPGYPNSAVMAAAKATYNDPQANGMATAAQTDKIKVPQSIWETAFPVTVQGGSLRTYSFKGDNVNLVQVALKTEGRPLNANVDLWQGPDNSPQKMKIFIEDGCIRPFSALIATPRGQNSVAIRNTGQVEFPLAACVQADVGDGYAAAINSLSDMTRPVKVQGGSLKTYAFDASVASVQILLETDGRPLNARIELLQGPNNNKQVLELYIENGLERPFFMVIETPGGGNVVRIVNTSPVEFPMSVRVEPYLLEVDGDELSGWVSDASVGGWDSKPAYGR